MIYGYIRVSTDRQTVENQRFEINQFCERNVMVVNKWIEETISGTKTVQERKLGKLLKKMKKEDVLICSELSRLGRNLLMIMGILNECMNRDYGGAVCERKSLIFLLANIHQHPDCRSGDGERYAPATNEGQCLSGSRNKKTVYSYVYQRLHTKPKPNAIR